MREDDDAPRRQIAHTIGEKLEDLSIHELDERILLLKVEGERLEAAKRSKQLAATAASSVFRI